MAEKAEKSATVRIKIHPGGADGKDMSDVFMSHNFVPINVPRNVFVDLPRKYYETCLKHAVVTTEIPDAEGKKTVTASTPMYTWTLDE